jgi:hypothetical protein
MLVAAARPAAVASQQVAVDGRDGKALCGVSVPLGVVQDLLVSPPSGSLDPGGQPIHHDGLASCGHLPKPVTQVVEAGDKGPVGLAVPKWRPVGQGAGRGCRRPRSWRCRPCGQRADTTTRPATRRRLRPGGPPAAVAGCRRCRAGAVAAGGPGERPAKPARPRAATSVGSMTTATRPPGTRATPCFWLDPVNIRTRHQEHSLPEH